ncbi:hypothetical protein Pint_07181 [Pistacia integerrima]|uniref:Uncharacterized protein n=1 Tax=Pistacia integerrima TaxID=434235 RepID=A0ACC0XT40_9ROSI|nr:hypothetical protein Pint_07181 [Pistacia integerrima]
MAFSRTPLISFLLISLLFASSMARLRLLLRLRHLCLLPLPKLDQVAHRLLQDYTAAAPSPRRPPHRHPLLHRFLLRLRATSPCRS